MGKRFPGDKRKPHRIKPKFKSAQQKEELQERMERSLYARQCSEKGKPCTVRGYLRDLSWYDREKLRRQKIMRAIGDEQPDDHQ